MRKTFGKFRIILLLLILLFVALQTWLPQFRTTRWIKSLEVIVYPINGDNSRVSSQFINNLNVHDFDDIEAFFSNEALRYGLTVDNPVIIRLAPEIKNQPPTPPTDGNKLLIIIWSLKMRYWAWTNNNYAGPKPDIQLFVKYFDPADNESLPHSLGLRKGLLGVINAFATERMAGANNVIIAHEFLHTVGATDKYDLLNNQPLYPIGFAEPHLQPLYPQTKAELMAGRIPLSQATAATPTNLKSVIIGELSAKEILWIKHN